MPALIFGAVVIMLHCLKKVRFSQLWVMLINAMLLPSAAVSALGIFFGTPSFLSVTDVIGTIGCLLIFIYQNISPSDPLSFRKIFSERAERLVGGRRLTISGLVVSSMGWISAVSGLLAMVSADSLFFGLEGETLRAATIATMGFNAVLGIIGAIISIILTATGIGRVICGEIMLINGLLRNIHALYEKSDKRTVLLILSRIPAVNIICAILVLKTAQREIKYETIPLKLKGEIS